MTPILDELLATIYSDGVAFMLLLGLILLSGKVKTQGFRSEFRRTAVLLFYLMCFMIMGIAVFNGISLGIGYQEGPMLYEIQFLSITFLEIFTLILAFLWILYVDFKLYASRDHLIRKYWPFVIPVLAYAVLLIVNFIVGVGFGSREEHLFLAVPLYFSMVIFEIVLFLYPIFLMHKYKKDTGKKPFFSIFPVLIPVFVGYASTFFTDYAPAALAMAMGITFMYFSMISEWRFVDETSGFFNRFYLEYLIDSDRSKAKQFNGAIHFHAGNFTGDLPGVLRQELPKDSLILFMEKGNYLFLSEEGSKMILEQLAFLVEETIEEVLTNQEDKDGESPGISDASTFSRERSVRKKEENGRAFLEKCNTKERL